MNSAKANIAISNIIQKIQMVCGVCSLTFGVLGLLVSLGDMESVDVGMILFFVGIGGLLIWRSIVRKKIILLFKTYVTILSADSSGSIDMMASILATSTDVVRKNLQKMIDKRFFTNAFIDTKDNCVVFPDRKNNEQFSNSTTLDSQSNHADIEYITVTCTGCGGVNKVQKGKVSECEFCGNVIK